MTLTTKRYYRKAFDIVRVIIHEWDPYGLLASGSPGDEFDSEIAAIVRQIPRIDSETDAALAISRVFSSSFEPELFRPESCAKMGARLYQALKASGFSE